MAEETRKMKHSPWFEEKIYMNHISQQRQQIFAKKVDRRYSKNNKKGDGYVSQLDYNNHLTKYYISNHPTLHLKIYTIFICQLYLGKFGNTREKLCLSYTTSKLPTAVPPRIHLEVLVTQSYLALCNPTDQVAVPSSRGSSQCRSQTWVSGTVRQILYHLSHQGTHLISSITSKYTCIFFFFLLNHKSLDTSICDTLLCINEQDKS